uniref:P/Homo B domain-containing protein n=1 Tax=Timema shepardi TaxID=629360 RepID=A0A7R9G095_TIMSH|nr:unnamed protein product [Timema shepardi]
MNLVPGMSGLVSPSRQIEVRGGSTLVAHMDVTGCSGTLSEVQFLEHVQCRVTMRFLPRGNLRLVLTSPSGTSSTLLFERPRDVLSASFDDWPFLSVHFWGEGVEGRWTLQVVNGGGQKAEQPGLSSYSSPTASLVLTDSSQLTSDSQHLGLLKKWQLIFYGTSINPIRLKSSANESSETTTLHQPISPAVRPSSGVQTDPKSFNSDVYYSSGGDQRSSSVSSSLSDEEKSYQENMVGTDSDGGKVLYSCDPECDHQGCYGQGPAQCVSCRRSCTAVTRSATIRVVMEKDLHNVCLAGGTSRTSKLKYLTYGIRRTCLCLIMAVGSMCVSQCPPRSFPNHDEVCRPCHESCETCAGAGQDSCLTCAPAHMYVTDLAVCLQLCPEGYYEDSDRNLCVPCEPNCASCVDRSDNCVNCEHHLVLHDRKCFATCPLHTHETEDSRCVPCHSSCETCNGSSETQCISCGPAHFSLAGVCHGVCPQGYYSHRKRRECLQCPPGCDTCNSTLCLTCDQGWILDGKGRCLPQGNSNCYSGLEDSGSILSVTEWSGRLTTGLEDSGSILSVAEWSGRLTKGLDDPGYILSVTECSGRLTTSLEDPGRLTRGLEDPGYFLSVTEWSGSLTTGLEDPGRLTTGLEDPGYILSVTEWLGRLTIGLEDPGSILSVTEWLGRLTTGLEDPGYILSVADWSGKLTTGLEDPGSILSVTEWSGRLTTGLEDSGSILSVTEWSGRLTTGLEDHGSILSVSEWSERLTIGLEDPGSILSVSEWSERLTTGLEDPGSILSVSEWSGRLTTGLEDSGEYWEGGHCRTCHSTCETCDGPNEYSCLSCPSPLLLQGSQCLATCLDGSYLDQGVCVPCLHTCKRCTSRVNCSQCAPGLFLQSGECRATCTTASDQGVCEKCYLSCVVPGTTVTRVYVLQRPGCLREVLPELCCSRYYSDQGVCEKCYLSCVVPGTTTSDQGVCEKCYLSCVVPGTTTSDQGVCEKCYLSCVVPGTTTSDQGVCEKCYLSCVVPGTTTSDQGVCEKCYLSCVVPGTTTSDQGVCEKCYLSCVVPGTTTSDQGVCEKCYLSCVVPGTTTSDQGVCEKCYLSCVVPGTTTSDQGVCEKCYLSCVVPGTTTSDQGVCEKCYLSCVVPGTTTSDQGVCEKCYLGCVVPGTTASDQGVCEKCYLSCVVPGTTVTRVYYSDQGVCEKCYLSCTTCSGPRKDHCINCPQGWKLAAGECQPECPEGFYSSNFGCNRAVELNTTSALANYATEAGEGPLNCTSCPPHYTPRGGLCTRCLSSQYYEATTQTCGPCHDSCRTCAGPNAFSCVTCLSPLQLDTFSQKCVKCCRGGQGKSCCHCDKITGRLPRHFFMALLTPGSTCNLTLSARKVSIVA